MLFTKAFQFDKLSSINCFYSLIMIISLFSIALLKKHFSHLFQITQAAGVAQPIDSRPTNKINELKKNGTEECKRIEATFEFLRQK